jgi:hypothetical protein
LKDCAAKPAVTKELVINAKPADYLSHLSCRGKNNSVTTGRSASSARYPGPTLLLRSNLLVDFQRISGLVFFDLKSQEVMNRREGLGAVARNTNSRALFRLFELVLNIAL